MSGLGETGLEYGFATGVNQVSPGDIDQYEFVNVDTPAVDTAWFSAGTTTGTTPVALQLKNLLGEWPRNLFYNYTGGTVGGTFVVNGIDQFGVPFTETVALGSQSSNGSVYGTAIAFKVNSGTFSGNTSVAGTMTVGYGTTANGSASSNWFGLWTKIAGTSDVKNIRWSNNGTVLGLNKGTAIGTLIDATRHAFQGTAGVAITDTYTVTVNPTFDNTFKTKLTNL